MKRIGMPVKNLQKKINKERRKDKDQRNVEAVRENIRKETHHKR